MDYFRRLSFNFVLVLIGWVKDTLDVQTVEGLHAIYVPSLIDQCITTKILVEGEDDEG